MLARDAPAGPLRGWTVTPAGVVSP
jgi:hypothetical protein